MILAVRTTHGVYLACDSRATNPQKNDVQKIFRCGSVAFIAICGVIVLSGTKRTTEGENLQATMDLMRTLEHFSLTSAVSGEKFVEYLRQVMFVSLCTFWDDHIRPYPEALRSAMASSPDTLFTIAGIVLMDNEVRIFEILFPFLPGGELSEPQYKYHDTERIVGWGRIEGIDGLDSNLSNLQGVVDYIALAYARSAISHPDSVGGHTDIGCINAHGARWISHK